MANEEHLAILNEGVEEWSRRQEKSRDERLDRCPDAQTTEVSE